MKRLLLLAVILLLHAGAARGQETVFVPNCGGDNDTSRIQTLITRIGSNTGTIRLPYKDGTRCAVSGSITFPENITLDNTDGTGLHRNTGAVVTILGPIVNPIGKPLFFGPGTTNLTGNTHVGTAGQALLSAGDGTTLWGVGGGGGGGNVLSVFNRTGTVTAQTGDYTWQQINKAISDIADITIRDASRLSNGITGSGPIVLQTSPTLITPTLGVASATSINKVVITPPTTSATLTIADGKTISFNNTLAVSGTDAKSLILTGSLSVGADTAISGGGALALGGFTGTLPTTGTFALGANTLSVTSSNNTNTSLHTHAISSSSNPGAAASILATNTSGFLQLTRLGIGTTPSQPLEVAGNIFINNPTANLFMRDTNTGWQAGSSTVVNPLAGNSVRSIPFTSGVDGWNVTASGDAEFNNVRVRGEIASSVFKFSEITATAGTLGVFKSASTLVFDTTSPTIGNSDTFEAENSDAGGSLFAVNDKIRFKGWIGSGVADVWYTVTAVVNNGATSTYTGTMESGSAGTILQAGMSIVDYGPSGTGFITLSTDGTVGASPNLTMATHLGAPWSIFTNLLRLGNLNQSYGYATDIYGLGIGQHGVAGQTWFTIEQTNGIRIGNNVTQLAQWDTSGNITVGQVAAGASNTFISAGQLRIRNNTTTRILLDTDGSGFVANSLFSWDASGNVNIAGNAVIAGWSITSTEVKSGSGATTVALNSTSTGGDDIRIYAGSSTAASAPFRVTEAGALTATNANITGAITATSGTFAGSLSAATGTFAGSLSAATGTFAGSLSAATGSFAGLLSAATGTFAGSLSAASGTFTGDLTGTNMALTGKLTMSGASSAIAIGATPPSSASVGTGLWFDRTGLYGLNSNTVQAKFDATNGKITSAGGNLVLDINGLSFINGFSSHINFVDTLGSSASGLILGSHTGGFGRLVMQAVGITAGDHAFLSLSAQDQANFNAAWLDLQSTATGGIAKIYSTGTFRGATIGANALPTASAVLDISSTTGAVLFPRMTTTQRDALTPTNGMVIYNSTTDKLQVRAAGAWVDLH